MTWKRATLLSTALALALSLPGAIASAAPLMHLSAANPTFTGTFGQTTLTTMGEVQIICNGENHVSGSWSTSLIDGKNSATTGTIQTDFTNCHTALGVNCNTQGAAAGVIRTTTGQFHLIYIKGFVKTPGLLITPVNGVFAEFSCGFGNTVKVTGKGVIGHLGSPLCGALPGPKLSLSFTSSAEGVQTYQEIEGSPERFTLESSFKGMAPAQSSLDASVVATLGGTVSAELTCT
jgi:hypothetical protein